jgi:hypothetical protein
MSQPPSIAVNTANQHFPKMAASLAGSDPAGATGAVAGMWSRRSWTLPATRRDVE